MKRRNRLALAILCLVSVMAALACSHSSTAPAWKTLPEPAAMPTPDESAVAPIDDIRMYYAIFNRRGGNPVLLIHGGPSTSDCWGNQVPVLAKGRQVIVADSRGHGRSTRSMKPFSYQLMADDYLKLLDWLKLDQVDIVGWSDGGIVGLDIAMRHPERVKKLWAFGANTNLAGLNPGYDEDPVVTAYLAQSRATYQRLSPTPTEFDLFIAAISAMWSTQPEYKPEQLATIVTPTVIADGAYDEIVKREHTEEIARLIPRARLLILSNTSHFAGWQNPELYNRELLEFLNYGSR